MFSSSSWLGIDLGGTFIKWEVVGDDGATLQSGKTPTPTTGHVDVIEMIVSIINGRKDERADLSGVGIAVPGHLAEDRESITLLPNVPGQWLGYPVLKQVRARTGLSATLLNDARAFALAELELGAAQGTLDVVFATIGTGVGGAVAVDGQVISSRRDSFGEVGHTLAVVDGELCSCGTPGCVEAYAGGAAVLARAKRRGVAISVGPDALTTLAGVADIDPTAASVLDEAYDAFAVGISTLCGFSGARLVVVGGAVAAELPGYIDRSRERLEQRRGLVGDIEIRAALLGSRAGALGAALAARREHSLHQELEHHA